MLTILTGGQTGVDRAAMDAGLEKGVAIGGWCPRGRRAEDGRVPDRYPIRETFSDTYASRTRKNVEQSEAVLVLHLGELDVGSNFTIEYAEMLKCPVKQVDLNSTNSQDAEEVAEWIRANRISKLNIAGPRESHRPGIYNRAREWVAEMLSHLVQDPIAP